MADNKYLITPWEVVQFGPVQKEYPTAYVVKHIPTKERKIFRECLGDALYKAMQEDVINWLQLQEWSKNTLYAKDARVIFHGCVIESLVDDNSSLPGVSFDWQVSKKFNEDCFNDLWEMHLREYLAFEVLFTSIRYATHTAGAKGLVEHFDTNTGSKTVGRTALMDWKRELKDDALDRLEDMKTYIIQAYKDGCEVFGEVPFVQKECGEDGTCNVSARRSRRVFFRH